MPTEDDPPYSPPAPAQNKRQAPTKRQAGKKKGSTKPLEANQIHSTPVKQKHACKQVDRPTRPSEADAEDEPMPAAKHPHKVSSRAARAARPAPADPTEEHKMPALGQTADEPHDEHAAQAAIAEENSEPAEQHLPHDPALHVQHHCAPPLPSCSDQVNQRPQQQRPQHHHTAARVLAPVLNQMETAPAQNHAGGSKPELVPSSQDASFQEALAQLKQPAAAANMHAEKQSRKASAQQAPCLPSANTPEAPCMQHHDDKFDQQAPRSPQNTCLGDQQELAACLTSTSQPYLNTRRPQPSHLLHADVDHGDADRPATSAAATDSDNSGANQPPDMDACLGMGFSSRADRVGHEQDSKVYTGAIVSVPCTCIDR